MMSPRYCSSGDGDGYQTPGAGYRQGACAAFISPVSKVLTLCTFVGSCHGPTVTYLGSGRAGGQVQAIWLQCVFHRR